MHILFHFIPGHRKSGSVRAEYRAGRILKISFKIITDPLDHLSLVVAWFITFKAQGQSSPSPCIGRHFSLIIPHGSDRGTAPKNHHAIFYERSFKTPLKPFDIRHRPAQCFLRNLQGKVIVWLQHPAACLHQSLTDCPVNGLAEISSLRMLNMRPPC